MVRQRVGVLESDGGSRNVHGEEGWESEVSFMDEKTCVLSHLVGGRICRT